MTFDIESEHPAATPHTSGSQRAQLESLVGWQDLLLLSDTLTRFVEAVRADDGDSGEVIGWAEAARGDVALWCWGFESVIARAERR